MGYNIQLAGPLHKQDDFLINHSVVCALFFLYVYAWLLWGVVA